MCDKGTLEKIYTKIEEREIKKKTKINSQYLRSSIVMKMFIRQKKNLSVFLTHKFLCEHVLNFKF